MPARAECGTHGVPSRQTRYLARCGGPGFEDRAVENPNDALGEVASWTPELVLMDLRLPGMDGLTLTRTLRADPANKSVLIVAFSAEGTAAEERRALDAGCIGYIAKPIDTATFGATVRSFLDVARPC